MNGRRGSDGRALGSSCALLLMSAGVIMGILAMQSLVLAGPETPTHHASMAVASDSLHATPDHQAPDAGAAQPGDETSFSATCGGMMAVCLALLVSVGARLILRTVIRRRILWTRPPPYLVRIGDSFPAFQALTPLQRTAILRC